MGLSVKVDEDLPTQVTGLLRGEGHYAETVVEQGMGGARARDDELWHAVQAEARFLVSH